MQAGHALAVLQSPRSYHRAMTARGGGVLARTLAVIGALPLVWFVAFTLSQEVPRLLVDDPCFVWGQSQRSTLSAPVGQPPCEHFVGISETKPAAVARLTAVQGSILVATVLALIGSFRGRPLLCGVGFLMIVLISVPLLLSGLGMITLLCGSFFLPSCYWTAAPRERA
jgi:hypothetical protein